ncbi:3'(2'),5'-bisphosphate nucleotidase CysQ [Candidatus Woesearchaeota archaeon]|nr:3'(2'),5'-bisphosphate nucleotidase CysQ [Candidatus Woesearchaeota archaeon]
MNYDTERKIALRVAEEAAKEIRRFYFGDFTVANKADGTPVTNADIAANRIIVDGLRKAFPEDGIISEELDDIAGGRTWYIDPIDGTKQFISHSDQFATHIGLAEAGKPVFGLVYKPLTREAYASQNDGACRLYTLGGGERQTNLNLREPNDNLVIVTNTSFLRSGYGAKIIENLGRTFKEGCQIITSGSQGLRMMKVAEGVADASIINMPNGCSTWDLCAPQAIVEAAGGYVAYLDGSAITYSGQRGLSGDFIVARSEELGLNLCSVIKSVLAERKS